MLKRRVNYHELFTKQRTNFTRLKTIFEILVIGRDKWTFLIAPPGYKRCFLVVSWQQNSFWLLYSFVCVINTAVSRSWKVFVFIKCFRINAPPLIKLK